MFPFVLKPCDLEDMFDLLLEDPLQNLQAVEDDYSLKLAKARRELLVLLHTQYITNVKPKLCGEGDGQQNCNDFFKGCPIQLGGHYVEKYLPYLLPTITNY